MKRKRLQTKTPDSANELATIVQRIVKCSDPDPQDLSRLRELVVSTPAVWGRITSITQVARQQLIEKITSGSACAYTLTESDVLKTQLGWDEASTVEKLLIDQVLTARLRLFCAESSYTSSVLGESISIGTAEYQEGRLSAAQTRYLKAIETLERVRRLGRNTPALQINIAQHGGQQVNTQGNVAGQAPQGNAPA